jgi:hypothetical protein
MKTFSDTEETSEPILRHHMIGHNSMFLPSSHISDVVTEATEGLGPACPQRTSKLQIDTSLWRHSNAAKGKSKACSQDTEGFL